MPADFDLGNSSSALIVYASYRDRLHLLDGRKHSLGITGGVGGAMKPKLATLGSITIGGVQIDNVPAEFPDAADNAFNSDRTIGDIGLQVLSRFRLLTDYADNALWLIPDKEALARPFQRNRAGLITHLVGDRLKILMVAPGSPAELAGWKESDEIIAIDGTKIGPNFRSTELSHWAQQPAGTTVTLQLANSSVRKITLADYY